MLQTVTLLYYLLAVLKFIILVLVLSFITLALIDAVFCPKENAPFPKQSVTTLILEVGELV